MQCPNDATVLVMSERSGIEIDYCPTCRGVWLERGELDKIIERDSRDYGQAAPAAQAPAAPTAPAAFAHHEHGGVIGALHGGILLGCPRTSAS